MRLSVKFSGAALLLLLVSLGGTAWLIIHYHTRSLHQQALERSRTLLSLGEAAREYTRETLSPAVRKAVGPHGVGLIFEADSATFVARGTFAAFRKRQPEYSFREAALNPLNPVNRADEAESILIEQFRSNRDLHELSGFRKVQGREVFYVARPILVKTNCLSCHDTPESAPAEVVARYGREHGYGWKVDETAAALIVTVPTNDIRAGQRHVVWTVVGVMTGAAVLLVVLLHVLFRAVVNRRLQAIGAVMERVASQPAADGPERTLSEAGNDELAALSRDVNRMARAVFDSYSQLEHRVADRTLLLMQANQALSEEVRERSRAEAEARQAVALAEAANRAKSQFLANMSHEIRTPMNGILGMTELALQTELSADQQDCLETVKSSAESLLTILNDILDFSKIEAGKLSLDPTPFRLRAALADTLKPLALRARAKGLELTSDIDAAAPDDLIGDVCRLRQVLVNLVGNAIKFTTQGKVVVTVQPWDQEDTEDVKDRASRSSTSYSSSTSHLLFAVTDTGVGIPPEKQQPIFDPFVQADGSTTRQFGGTGLGLSISARLVEMMGGRIEVRSEPGRGSTFSFTARLLVQASESSQPVGSSLPSAATPARPALRLLLVEDNVVNQRLAVRLLEKQGHSVHVVENGAAAVEAVASESFDLVLMDVQMPVMGGLEATAAIRAREMQVGGHVPIVAMTANAMAGDREACLAAGMDAYVAKPVQAKNLFEVMARAMADHPRRETPVAS